MSLIPDTLFKALQPALTGVSPSFCQCQTWQWSPLGFAGVLGDLDALIGLTLIRSTVLQPRRVAGLFGGSCRTSGQDW